MSQYNSGTVDVTNGSAVVIGNGTSWTGQLAAGDIFTVVGSGVWYVIGSVDSDTQITLTANYAGSTASAQSYTVVRDFTPLTGLPYPTKGDIETHEVLKRALLMLDSTPGGANIVPFSLEHDSDGTHKHVHADRISTGTQVAQNTGEVAAVRIRLPGGTIDSPQQATTQSLKGAIDGGASAALNSGQSFELLDPSGARKLLAVDPDRGLAGMIGNIMSPLVHIPFKRQNDEVALSGTQTFTRASTATYTDPLDGLLKTAAIDTPRFERMADGGIGLLVEGASTNLLLQSEALDVTPWSVVAATITPDATAAPDGATTADKLVEDTTANNSHFVQQTVSGVTGGSTYTFSVWAQPAGRDWLIMQFHDGAGWHFAYFDLLNGVIGNTNSQARITKHGAWYRCQVTAAVDAAATSLTLYLQTAISNGSSSYTGDGTSGIYLWGAQLEVLPFASSYIPTTTATVTRAADSLTLAVAGNACPDHTIIMDFDLLGMEGATQGLWEYQGAVVDAYIHAAGNIINRNYGVFGNAYTSAVGPAIGQVMRVSARQQSGTEALFTNSTLASTATGGLVDYTAAWTLRIGDYSGSNQLFGHIRNLRIYDRALSDVEMAAA